MRERVRLLCFLLLSACGGALGAPADQDASTGHNGSDDRSPDGTGGGGSGEGTPPDGRGEGDDPNASDGNTSDDGSDMAGNGNDGVGNDGNAGDDGGSMPSVKRTFVYVGGWDWSNNSAYPFRAFELERTTGALEPLGDAIDLGPNPSFVTTDADGEYLFIANEMDGPNGGVTVARIDRGTGALTKVAHQNSGSGFVYVTVAPGGEYVLAASYSQGEVTVFPFQDGVLGPASDTLEVSGHAHAVRLSTNAEWAYVPNLGRHEINQLTFTNGALGLNPAQAALATGSNTGPRHIDIHPNGRFAYVMFEYTPRLTAYSIQGDGTLQEIESVRTVADEVSERSGAHVLIHPNGKFVYVSNREDTSIACFAIADDGSLTLIQRIHSRGVHPRNFDIDAAGAFMVVANKGADGATNGNLAVFRVESDGTLTPVGDPLDGLKEPTGVAIVNVY